MSSTEHSQGIDWDKLHQAAREVTDYLRRLAAKGAAQVCPCVWDREPTKERRDAVRDKIKRYKRDPELYPEFQADETE